MAIQIRNSIARICPSKIPIRAIYAPAESQPRSSLVRGGEELLGGLVRGSRDPSDTSTNLFSLLGGFALPLNDLIKIGHDPPR